MNFPSGIEWDEIWQCLKEEMEDWIVKYAQQNAKWRVPKRQIETRIK